MVQYRRNKIKGGTYFFTVTLKDRQSDMLCQNISLLRKAFKITHNKHSFIINAIVILLNRERPLLQIFYKVVDVYKNERKTRVYTLITCAIKTHAFCSK